MQATEDRATPFDGIPLKMDRQTEQINAGTERYLNGFINYLQDNWGERLALAEFAGNNDAS